MRGRFPRAVAAALLIVAALAGPAAAQEPPPPDADTLLTELGRGRVAVHSESGLLRFAGGSAKRPSAANARLGRPGNARAAARAFMARYGTLFGVRDATRGLQVQRTIDGGAGRTFVRLQQVEGEVPVLAGQLTVQVDGGGNVISVLGEAWPGSDIDLLPTVTPAAARAEALAVTARAHGLKPSQLQASQPELWIYDPALLGPSKLPHTRLVWRLEVRNDARDIDDFVLVDALHAVVALRFEQVAHAKSRRVCDGGNADAKYPCTTPVLTESSGSSSVADVNNAFTHAGQTYDFFFKRFGRDSLDGAGRTLTSTVRFCGGGNCSALNAFWDGDQAVFWPGMASDDVIAHEFVHGFTQYTSNLFYYYQSGAINEALSDIFGEFVDLTNGAGNDGADVRWKMGEDTIIGAIRDMKNPTAAPYNNPDRMRSPLYVTDPGLSDNGGVHSNSGVANKAAYLMVDGETFNGQTVTGIGLDKSAALWYRVAAHYLASGSDYEDLGLALNQACSDLLGTSARDNSGAVTGTIAAADCTQVAKAVTATEMTLQPTAAGAAAPEAPVCTSGTPSDIFFDQIVEGGSGWSTGGTPNRWFYDSTYATSKPWHMWGSTPGSSGDARLRRINAVTLPAKAFLHFRHDHFFDNYLGVNYDGGIVEYQVGSDSWIDARTLFTHNGYNGTIASGVGNVLGGRAAFTAYTWGYISSRIDLSSLAGKSVRFRFRTATDGEFADYGWFIDDVRLYTCTTVGGDSTPPTVTAPNANLRSGVAVGGGSQPVKINVSFGASDESGISKTQLQKRANSNSYSNISLATGTSTSANQKFPTSSSTKRQFRARATDNNGNQSTWATAKAFRVLAHQNGSSAVTQAGTWKTASKSSFYGGNVRHSRTAGSKQSRTAVVSDFAIVSTLGPNRGRADVYVDNVYQATIDLYASSLQYRRVVYAIDFGAAGSHTIELRVKGTKRAASSGVRVDFDAFLALAP